MLVNYYIVEVCKYVKG